MTVKTGEAELRFAIEIARTREQLAYGLMHRESLPEDYAMLFIFGEDAQHEMWMKDTPLPLDMLFVDKHGRIVYIDRRAIPDSTAVITTPQPVRAVIEMPGGTVDKKNIQVGDQVIHPYFMP